MSSPLPRRGRGQGERGRWFHNAPYLIGAYTADFICIDRNLIVELDGGIHLLKEERDRLRDAIIGTRGYRVLRFENWQITEKLDDVLRTVLHYLENPDLIP